MRLRRLSEPAGPAFGGPAAQIALMHRVVLDEKRWVSEGEYLRALSFADSYTCNGGISHAIDCLDEADMAVLVPALDAIAPAPARELWREALHAVAPNGLPADHESRQELLMERHAEIADQLDELSNRYFRSKWRLYVAMATYATANRDQLAS